MLVILRVADLSIGDISITVSRAVMIWPFTATCDSREATFTASPKMSPSACTTIGPQLKPMRMPILVLPTGFSSPIADCISIAASAAASVVGNEDMTSSPMVLMTRPLAVTVHSLMMRTH